MRIDHVGPSQTDEYGKNFWDESYRVKKTPALWCDEPVPFVRAAVQKFANISAFTTLELPCGDGKNTGFLATHLPCIVAADASQNALAIAQKRLDAVGKRNCVLCTTDAFATQFADSQFDAVFCCDLLGHLEQLHIALKELLRVCRPGGLVVANVFAIGDSTRVAEHMTNIRSEEYLYQNKFYFRFYTETEVRDVLEISNAEIIGLELSRWMEGPHEGYREYPHEHQSWVFTLRKR